MVVAVFSGQQQRQMGGMLFNVDLPRGNEHVVNGPC